MLEREVSVYSNKLWELSLLSNYISEARESTKMVGSLLVNCTAAPSSNGLSLTYTY